MSMNRVQKKLKDRTVLLGAGGNDRPNPLAPAAAGLAPRPLGNAPVDHHEANRLFGQVVGRLDARRGDEPERYRIPRRQGKINMTPGGSNSWKILGKTLDNAQDRNEDKFRQATAAGLRRLRQG